MRVSVKKLRNPSRNRVNPFKKQEIMEEKQILLLILSSNSRKKWQKRVIIVQFEIMLNLV